VGGRGRRRHRGLRAVLSDRTAVSYLATLVVRAGDRRHGIGRELVARLLAASGVARIDLLAEPGVTGFDETFLHKRKPGFRIYPDERS
jgi:hypothetical protein